MNYIKFKKDFLVKCKLKDKKLCDFFAQILYNKYIYKCIYPQFIEKELKKIISK